MRRCIASTVARIDGCYGASLRPLTDYCVRLFLLLNSRGASVVTGIALMCCVGFFIERRRKRRQWSSAFADYNRTRKDQAA